MTQRNIDIMDKLVDMLIDGDNLSAALGKVYSKRKVRIPYTEEILTVSVQKMGLPQRVSNALMRAKLHTLNDVVEYCQDNQIKEIQCLGKNQRWIYMKQFLIIVGRRWTIKQEQIFLLIP